MSTGSGLSTPASSRQLSATVRTPSMPSDDHVPGPSASMSSTDLPLRAWSAAARFVATVVLPTPPLGLKTAIVVAFPPQLPVPKSPPWRIGPLPSSTVSRRIHMASTRQRIESAE
jgi:hypothetical protein